MSPFVTKDWHDSPTLDTPLSAAAMEDIEMRLSDYTDDTIGKAGGLAGVVNPMHPDYGAAGDGVTDDTAALDAAATAAGTGTLYLPDGTFLHTGTWQPGGRVIGSGTIKRSGSSTAILAVPNAAGAMFEGITFDKNGIAGNTVVCGYANSGIRNCTIKNSVGQGIEATSVDGLIVENCTFEDVDSYAVMFENCTRFRVNGNRIINASSGLGVFIKSSGGDRASDGTVNGNVIEVTGTAEGIGIWADRVAVSGNSVSGGVLLPISLAGANHCTVTANTISGAPIELAEGSTYCTIADNVIKDSVGTAIWATIGGGSATPGGHTITGNTIDTPACDTNVGAIDLYYSNCTVANNIIIDAGAEAAILLHGSITNNTIAHNTIRFTSTSYNGITLSGTNHLVSGNLIDATGVGTNNGYGISSSSPSNAGYNIVGNNVIGLKKGIYLDDTDYSMLDGNRTMDCTEDPFVITASCTKCFVGTHHARDSGGYGTISSANSVGAALFGDGVVIGINTGTWPP